MKQYEVIVTSLYVLSVLSLASVSFRCLPRDLTSYTQCSR